MNTFNKVWIIPDEADIYEKGNVAYLYKSHLKVMLEEDYLSLQKHSGITSNPVILSEAKDLNHSLRDSSEPMAHQNDIHTLASNIVRQIILPQLEQEVNGDKNFAPLRQVFSGMILAAWYKRALRESLLAKIYADKALLKGVDQNPQNNEAIYQQYLKAYKKGVFNFIKEDTDKYTNETIPRKYFSGGWAAPQWVGPHGVMHRHRDPSAAMTAAASLNQYTEQAGVDLATVSVDPSSDAARKTNVINSNGQNQAAAKADTAMRAVYTRGTYANFIDFLLRRPESLGVLRDNRQGKLRLTNPKGPITITLTPTDSSHTNWNVAIKSDAPEVYNFPIQHVDFLELGIHATLEIIRNSLTEPLSDVKITPDTARYIVAISLIFEGRRVLLVRDQNTRSEITQDALAFDFKIYLDGNDGGFFNAVLTPGYGLKVVDKPVYLSFIPQLLQSELEKFLNSMSPSKAMTVVNTHQKTRVNLMKNEAMTTWDTEGIKIVEADDRRAWGRLITFVPQTFYGEDVDIFLGKYKNGPFTLRVKDKSGNDKFEVTLGDDVEDAHKAARMLVDQLNTFLSPNALDSKRRDHYLLSLTYGIMAYLKFEREQGIRREPLTAQQEQWSTHVMRAGRRVASLDRSDFEIGHTLNDLQGDLNWLSDAGFSPQLHPLEAVVSNYDYGLRLIGNFVSVSADGNSRSLASQIMEKRFGMGEAKEVALMISKFRDMVLSIQNALEPLNMENIRMKDQLKNSIDTSENIVRILPKSNFDLMEKISEINKLIVLAQGIQSSLEPINPQRNLVKKDLTKAIVKINTVLEDFLKSQSGSINNTQQVRKLTNNLSDHVQSLQSALKSLYEENVLTGDRLKESLTRTRGLLEALPKIPPAPDAAMTHVDDEFGLNGITGYRRVLAVKGLQERIQEAVQIIKDHYIRNKDVKNALVLFEEPNLTLVSDNNESQVLEEIKSISSYMELLQEVIKSKRLDIRVYSNKVFVYRMLSRLNRSIKFLVEHNQDADPQILVKLEALETIIVEFAAIYFVHNKDKGAYVLLNEEEKVWPTGYGSDVFQEKLDLMMQYLDEGLTREGEQFVESHYSKDDELDWFTDGFLRSHPSLSIRLGESLDNRGDEQAIKSIRDGELRREIKKYLERIDPPIDIESDLNVIANRINFSEEPEITGQKHGWELKLSDVQKIRLLTKEFLGSRHFLNAGKKSIKALDDIVERFLLDTRDQRYHYKDKELRSNILSWLILAANGNIILRPDRAMAHVTSDHLGGIDMNAAHLDLHIKRDGHGVPLPVSLQDLAQIHIDGLVPHILEIKSAALSPEVAQLMAPIAGASS